MTPKPGVMLSAKNSFADWWFLAGGGIHRAEKYGEISKLAVLAKTLPKLAWDHRQEEIDALRKELELARRVIDAVRTMKTESLLYENWYTFVTCEFGEAVDDALEAYDAAVGREGGK